ncbi:endonuclease/exonuclease/phosphatase family protein [Mucilaginibacter pallidiroseus]|uniref:Endonuclease/exonuclease/phosphatase family protein n=1 Tax=Mucilaginibacter pallidiroseus TaxID=2599295 RepID=A0A563U8D9_9SPHI|nr:endonuclease/exonuclease/phosphatase family protein [Mucilaginibacter pallidiroseus]TWR27584.1 endonuclease/exonuclease/phosphatase family protein [Mucilaginibacter pallidiroseus]
MPSSKNPARQKPGLSLFDKIILACNILASLLLLLSYLSPTTDPRDIWILALLGLGFPFLVLANLFFIFFWIFRRIKLALISAISILVGFKFILMNITYHENNYSSKSKTVNSLRIMQYNVHGFVGIGAKDGVNIKDEILETIAIERPDIITFEDYVVSNATKTSSNDSVKAALKLPNYYFVKLSKKNINAAGNAIFSKYPIVNSGVVDTTSFNKQRSIFVDIKYNDKKIRIYAVHLQSVMFKTQEHAFLKGNVSVSKSEQVSDKLKKAFIYRSYEVAKLKRHIENCPHPYIISGDFNDTPMSFAFNELISGMKSTYQEKGYGLGYTYYNDFPNVQIDHILVSSQINILNYFLKKAKLSDHYPIISDIEVN